MFSAVASLLFATGLYGAILLTEISHFGWQVVAQQFTQYGVWAPFVMIVFGSLNLKWRFKVIGWLIFSGAFICLSLVFTAMMMFSRLSSPQIWIHFMAALLMYGALMIVGLLQLRTHMKVTPIAQTGREDSRES